MIKSVFVRYRGGLGNQLYAYTFCRWLSDRLPEYDVYSDVQEYKLNSAHDGNQVSEIFQNSVVNEANMFAVWKVTNQIPIFYGGIGKDRINAFREVLNKRSKVRNWYEETKEENADIILERIRIGDRYVDGYWQDSYYFNCIKKKIIRELAFKDEGDEKLKQMIRDNNSVSIHVRRGDYVGGNFDVVRMSYYIKAISYFDKLNIEPLFFVFSDDTEYVRNEFAWLPNKIVVEKSGEKKDYFDMYYMSLCKHNIITNSSFSTWAAYLNRNDKKKVIYPDLKFMEKKRMDGWIALNYE